MANINPGAAQTTTNHPINLSSNQAIRLIGSAQVFIACTTSKVDSVWQFQVSRGQRKCIFVHNDVLW